jgi:hypothetical protein
LHWLPSARGWGNLGGALDITFALVIAEHLITEKDMLAVARLPQDILRSEEKSRALSLVQA